MAKVKADIKGYVKVKKKYTEVGGEGKIKGSDYCSRNLPKYVSYTIDDAVNEYKKRGR